MMYVATAMLLLVASCSFKKKLVSPMAHAVDYEWMTAKMNGELTLTDHHSPLAFTGQLRMRRDSIIWVSATLMGMEAVRVLVTTDSVFMINRLEKTYLAEPFSTVETMCTSSPLVKTETMCTSSLQALLLGNGTNDTVVIPWGPYTAKIHYTDIQWDIPTTFPIKINENYERMR